jgi:hypothetical protein
MSLPKAVKFRPRQTDNYDPGGPYKWIVEVSPRFEPGNAPDVIAWIETNTNATSEEFILYGRCAGFVEHDDAWLFYLAFA